MQRRTRQSQSLLEASLSRLLLSHEARRLASDELASPATRSVAPPATAITTRQLLQLKPSAGNIPAANPRALPRSIAN